MHIIHNEVWFNGRFCADDDNMIRLRTGPDEDLINIVEVFPIPVHQPIFPEPSDIYVGFRENNLELVSSLQCRHPRLLYVSAFAARSIHSGGRFGLVSGSSVPLQYYVGLLSRYLLCVKR